MQLYDLPSRISAWHIDSLNIKWIIDKNGIINISKIILWMLQIRRAIFLLHCRFFLCFFLFALSLAVPICVNASFLNDHYTDYYHLLYYGIFVTHIIKRECSIFSGWPFFVSDSFFSLVFYIKFALFVNFH